MEKQIKIIIADDHPIVRQGLRQMIESDRNFTVVGEAGDGRNALRLIEDQLPDVAVLDIDMPELSGFELVEQLKEKKIEVGVIFLTMHSEEEIFQKAMDLGVRGYVLKDSATTDIVAGIKSIAEGKPYISPALTFLLLNRQLRTEKLRSEKPGLERLSPTERRVLKFIAADKTSREIGEALFISHRTVHAHRANICQKLNLRGNLALVKFAISHRSEL